MIDKFKGVYRLKVPYNLKTNQFSRKLDGSFEDVDIYIDCQYGNQITYYGRSILQAYIPNLIRGRNIIKSINQIDSNLIFDIEETDRECLFKFNYKNSDKIIPYLKPKTSGSNISPYSSKNLPKTKYSIPDEDLNGYKTIVSKLPQNELITLVHSTKTFLQSLATKKNTWDDIKADMAVKGLRGKEYIHCIGQWEKYLDYLRKELQ